MLMIDLEKAKEIIGNVFPSLEIMKIYFNEKEWIFKMKDRESEEDLDISPYTIDKLTGKIGVHFYPAHVGEKLEEL